MEILEHVFFKNKTEITKSGEIPLFDEKWVTQDSHLYYHIIGIGSKGGKKGGHFMTHFRTPFLRGFIVGEALKWIPGVPPFFIEKWSKTRFLAFLGHF